MARIRTTKPEFWGDEKLAPLDPLTRLVFLGLISMADDAGRLIDNVKSIDGFVFPETDDTAHVALVTLAKLSRISRYTVASGQRVIQISNWSRHQKVDKPSTYVLPAEGSRDSRDTLEESSRSDLGPRTVDLGPTIKDHGPPRVNADSEWDALVGLIPTWQRKEWTAEKHAALSDGTKRGLSKIGGFAAIVGTPADKIVWLRKEFVAAYNG